MNDVAYTVPVTELGNKFFAETRAVRDALTPAGWVARYQAWRANMWHSAKGNLCVRENTAHGYRVWVVCRKWNGRYGFGCVSGNEPDWDRRSYSEIEDATRALWEHLECP